MRQLLADVISSYVDVTVACSQSSKHNQLAHKEISSTGTLEETADMVMTFPLSPHSNQ